jgi:hypothetical protein
MEKISLLTKNSRYNLYKTDSGLNLVFLKDSQVEFFTDQTSFIFTKSNNYIAIDFVFCGEYIFHIRSLRGETLVMWIRVLDSDIYEDYLPKEELLPLNNKINSKKCGLYDTFLSATRIVSFPEQLGVKENGSLENDFYFIDPNLKLVKIKIENFEELFK